MINTSGTLSLVDTNLFVYALDAASPYHTKTAAVFARIAQGEVAAVVAQQNIVECMQVFERSGYKKRTEVVRNLSGLIGDLSLRVIAPTPMTHLRFFSLLPADTRSIDVFDYYLAATMLTNGVGRILTLNQKDFAAIEGIEAVNPL